MNMYFTGSPRYSRYGVSSRTVELSRNKIRNYGCALCPSAFGSKMELEEHINSHTGDKPFACDVCHTRFNRRSTLWNHRRIHSGKKPFQCPICKLQFKWKNSLKCHRLTHLRRNDVGSDKFDAETIDKMSFAGGTRRRRKDSLQIQIENFTEKDEMPSKFKNFVFNKFNPNEYETVAGDDGNEMKGHLVLSEQSEEYSESLFLSRFMVPVQPTSALALPTVCLPDDPETIKEFFNIYCNNEAAPYYDENGCPNESYSLDVSLISDIDKYVPFSPTIDHDAYAKVVPSDQW